MAFEISILVLSIVGLAISGYIYYKKKHKEQLVCVIGEDCDKVVNSRWSTTFGIENEIMGMLYYVFVAIGIGLLLSGVSSLFGIPVLAVLLLAGAGASLFSIYLTYIQIFVIHEWCEYCLSSAAVTIAIFVLEVLI